MNPAQASVDVAALADVNQRLDTMNQEMDSMKEATEGIEETLKYQLR